VAITFTNLGASTGTTEVNPDLRDVGDATSYANTSWSPPGSGIVFAFVLSGQNTVTDTAVDSFVHNGVAFTRIGTDLEFSGGQRRVSMFAAFASLLSTGVTTVDFGTDTQIFCYVSFFQIEGADESGSISNAFIPATGTSGTDTSGSLTLAAPQNSDSRSIAAVGHVTNEVVTKGANFTQIDDMNGAGPALGWVSEFSTSQFETTADASWTTSSAWGAGGAEVKAAGGAPAEKQSLYVSSSRRVAR
jgi:hypothetical protein